MSNQDETLMGGDDGEQRPKLPAERKPDDTVELSDDQPSRLDPEAAGDTFALPDEQTLVEDTSIGDTATIGDAAPGASSLKSGSVADDGTILESLSGITPPSQENAEDVTLAALPPVSEEDAEASVSADDQSGTQLSLTEEDSDRTSADDDPEEDDATIQQTFESDDDATMNSEFADASFDPDATVAAEASQNRTDPDGTIVEGETGAASSSGSEVTGLDSAGVKEPSRGNWGRTKDAKQKKRPSSGKGVHETVNRWDSEQRYQLVSNFARGGLGQIWMANDSRLRREVAFKELLPRALKNRSALRKRTEQRSATKRKRRKGRNARTGILKPPDLEGGGKF